VPETISNEQGALSRSSAATWPKNFAPFGHCPSRSDLPILSGHFALTTDCFLLDDLVGAGSKKRLADLLSGAELPLLYTHQAGRGPAFYTEVCKRGVLHREGIGTDAAFDIPPRLLNSPLKTPGLTLSIST
jgi:hypothetical protein